MKITNHGPHGGRVVEADPGAGLADIKREWLLEQLADAGYLLLRGFGGGRDGFSDLVRRVSSRITLDPARSFGGDTTVQKVDAGTAAIGLHVEHGNNPFTPHLTWFYSERAARAGSQTTFCDGYTLWDGLSEPTRQAFLDNDIVYTRRKVEEPKWKLLAFHLNGQRVPMEELTVSHLSTMVPDPSRMDIRLNEDKSVYYAYRTPAAHPTVFGERLAFANSIFGPSYNYEAPTITFADGSEIPQSILDEIECVSAPLIQDVNWRDGDLVVADNTRILHGRREIIDTERQLLNALSFIEV